MTTMPIQFKSETSPQRLTCFDTWSPAAGPILWRFWTSGLGALAVEVGHWVSLQAMPPVPGSLSLWPDQPCCEAFPQHSLPPSWQICLQPLCLACHSGLYPLKPRGKIRLPASLKFLHSGQSVEKSNGDKCHQISYQAAVTYCELVILLSSHGRRLQIIMP